MKQERGLEPIECACGCGTVFLPWRATVKYVKGHRPRYKRTGRKMSFVTGATPRAKQRALIRALMIETLLAIGSLQRTGDLPYFAEKGREA